MGRSVKKGPYVEPSLLVKITALNEKNEKKVFKTWSRRSTITPDFVGHTLAVHNGNKFIPVYITEDRKSTRLNSSHDQISYAVFCLKKKKRHFDDCRKLRRSDCRDRGLHDRCRLAFGEAAQAISRDATDLWPRVLLLCFRDVLLPEL